jgi:hypothetical protein
MARSSKQRPGRDATHAPALGRYVYPGLSPALARATFLEILDGLSGGKLRQGLQALLPEARDYKAAGWTLDWGHLEAAVDPQGKALASQLRELFEGLGLTRERLPDPWPFEVACRTLGQALEFPDPNGKITFETTLGFWEHFDPEPIHPLLPGVLYDPFLRRQLPDNALLQELRNIAESCHEPALREYLGKLSADAELTATRPATQEEERERLVASVKQAVAYLEALARLYEVLGENPHVAFLVEPWFWLPRADIGRLPGLARFLGGHPEDERSLRDALRLALGILRHRLSILPKGDEIPLRVTEYMKRMDEKAKRVGERPYGLDPVAYTGLAARLLGKRPIAAYDGGKKRAYVLKEIRKLAKLLPIEFEPQRGRPRDLHEGKLVSRSTQEK